MSEINLASIFSEFLKKWISVVLIVVSTSVIIFIIGNLISPTKVENPIIKKTFSLTYDLQPYEFELLSDLCTDNNFLYEDLCSATFLNQIISHTLKTAKIKIFDNFVNKYDKYNLLMNEFSINSINIKEFFAFGNSATLNFKLIIDDTMSEDSEKNLINSLAEYTSDNLNNGISKNLTFNIFEQLLRRKSEIKTNSVGASNIEGVKDIGKLVNNDSIQNLQIILLNNAIDKSQYDSSLRKINNQIKNFKGLNISNSKFVNINLANKKFQKTNTSYYDFNSYSLTINLMILISFFNTLIYLAYNVSKRKK